MLENPHALVATLGGQPQIVTFTLDLLLQAGYPISEVIVLHPRAREQSRLQSALQLLYAEITGDYYQERQHTIHFYSQILELGGQPIDDIVDDEYADGTLNTIHHLIGNLKRQGYRIHLSLSGGRRLMSLLAISVAAFNFDRHDHIWHIYTPDSIKEQAHDGNIMHVPADAGVKLIKGPFIALGAYIYEPERPFRTAQEERRLQMEAQESARCTEVVSQATPAQLKVLQAFARGLRPQRVAEELSVTVATVHSHKTVLLDYCRSAWNVLKEERLDYHFLSVKFASYFQTGM